MHPSTRSQRLRFRFRFPFTAWTAIGIALALAGCSIVPKPIDADLNAPKSRSRLAGVIAAQQPVAGPISLYEAMARALKYNLDEKIEVMAAVLRQRQLDLSHYDLLPSLVTSAGFSNRSNEAAASSKSILSGRQSLEPSVSSERKSVNADLALSWDVLDFGLSYVRAQQAADEKLIAIESRRKVVNRILEDVRTAYWRAVSADRTYRKLVDLEVLAQRALRQAEELEKRRISPPLTVLAYQRDLLQISGDVQRLQRELSLAKGQLAALMNLPPDFNYPLQLPDRNDVVPELPGSAEEMVLVGLLYRPELREAAYRQRINRHEMDAALLRTLPSIKTLLGINYDSNDYLTNNRWGAVSARITWNLLEVFRYPAKKQVLEAEAAVMDQRDLALTMAVLTQVHFARVRFLRLTQEIGVIGRAQSVEARIVELSRQQFKARALSQQSLVREEMNAVLAEIRYDSIYADLQNAYANLYASMGLDNFEIDLDTDMPLAAMTERLQTHWTEQASQLPSTSETPDERSQNRRSGPRRRHRRRVVRDPRQRALDGRDRGRTDAGRGACPDDADRQPVDRPTPPGVRAGAGQRHARGVVRAVREATLSSRLAARIADMPLAEGATFKSGALLVRFDCERQSAEARAAAAVVEVQKKTVDTNEELDKFESIGKNDLAISRSVLDKARAESDAQKSQLKDCNVYAPFTGRVVERIAHNYEAVAVSQPLLKVVDTSALELDLIVPSAWLQWLNEGSRFQFRIDETDQVVAAKVLRLTPTVDPVSRTIRIIGQLTPGKNLARVLPGMSGTATFDRSTR